jgi:hypothetical protein
MLFMIPPFFDVQTGWTFKIITPDARAKAKPLISTAPRFL